MSNIVHCPLIEWCIVIAKSHKLMNGITELPNYIREHCTVSVHNIVSNSVHSITSLFYNRRAMLFLESIPSERKFSGNLVRNETLDPLNTMLSGEATHFFK